MTSGKVIVRRNWWLRALRTFVQGFTASIGAGLAAVQWGPEVFQNMDRLTWMGVSLLIAGVGGGIAALQAAWENRKLPKDHPVEAIQ